MSPNDIMPPIQGSRIQPAAVPPQSTDKPQYGRAKPPGISPGVQALMRQGMAGGTNYGTRPPGAPGAFPVRPGQQYQGMAKPMPMQPQPSTQPQPMPFQGQMQNQDPQNGGQFVDPYLQRRLGVFGGYAR